MNTRSLIPLKYADLNIPSGTRKTLTVTARIAGIRGFEGLITYILLGLMGLIVAWSVQLADWGDSPVLIWTVLVGMALGVAFVRPIGPWPLRHLFGILFGFLFAMWQVSFDADGSNVFLRFVDVCSRVDIWFDIAMADGISTDPLPFSVFLSVIAWFVAYAAGWSLFKFRTPWAPSFIFGVVILTNLSYRFHQFEYTFYFFAAIAIALFAHLTLVNTRRRWKIEGVRHSNSLNADAILAPIAIGAIVVVIAGFLPMYAVRPDVMDRAWGAMKDPLRDRLSDDALRLFPNVGGVGRGDLRAFDQVMAFKGRISFKQDPIFFIGTRYEILNPARVYSVYTSQGWLTGPVAEFNRQPADSLPLEGTLIDRIVIEQQIVSDEQKLGFAIPSDYALNIDRSYISEELPPLRVQLNMVIGDLDPRLPDDILVYAEALRNIYVERQIFDRPPVEDVVEELLPPDLEIISFKAGGLTLESITVQRVTDPIFDQVAARLKDRSEPGESVTVRRLVSQATEEQLHNAGTDYPLWVTDRYLQLPSSVPSEVFDLASKIIDDAGAETPYSMTEALTAYLLDFGYSQDIEGPDPNQDGVSYFLFDTAFETCGGGPLDFQCVDERPKGYSQYFGSAMAVMLRTQGVPARMVSGFNSGTFDQEREGFVIRDVDSHGWAQAYFPNYGWIDLESTPGARQPVRGVVPEVEITIASPTDTFAAGKDTFTETGEFPSGRGDGPNTEEFTTVARRDNSVPVWPLILVSVIGMLVMASVITWRWRFWAMSPTGRAYAGMSRLGWLSGNGRWKHETPYEYAVRLGDNTKNACDGAQLIARAYEFEVYSGRETPEMVLQNVHHVWPLVRWALIRRALLRLIGIKGRHPFRVSSAINQ